MFCRWTAAAWTASFIHEFQSKNNNKQSSPLTLVFVFRSRLESLVVGLHAALFVHEGVLIGDQSGLIDGKLRGNLLGILLGIFINCRIN
jgi:hypothetical protein